MIVTGFGVTTGAEIACVSIVSAEEMADNGANHREQETESQASNVDYHKASVTQYWLIKSLRDRPKQAESPAFDVSSLIRRAYL